MMKDLGTRSHLKHKRRPLGRLFKMTEEEAREFSSYSVKNAALVKAATVARGCGCDAYKDVFSPRRWAALGCIPKDGEKPILLPFYGVGFGRKKSTAYMDPRLDDLREEEGKPALSAVRYMGDRAVFCRHQVRGSAAFTDDVIIETESTGLQPGKETPDASI